MSDRVRVVNTQDGHAKRKGRLARLEHATATWTKSRGGPSRAELTRLALHALVYEAGREAIGYAATILGHERPRDATAAELLSAADTPLALVRVAGAVAYGLAETAMYWSSSSSKCRAYLDLLCATGWTPDEWTAAALARHDERHASETEDEVGDELGDEFGDEAGDVSDDDAAWLPDDEADDLDATA